ncbi:unnamed protein product [Diatraea saccharalis]|uniref:Zinc finger DNA binding protein n=1 Tax=Diatraea saccharalis TaxID=40085 RepID=A0A9N9R6R3_9NEOP|nr:unnamed protein product [Diatraea saccharalis]
MLVRGWSAAVDQQARRQEGRLWQSLELGVTRIVTPWGMVVFGGRIVSLKILYHMPGSAKCADADPAQQAITTRKRKTPDGNNICLEDFHRELTDTLSEYRLELKETLREFQRNITSSFEALFNQQNETIKKIRGDLSNLQSEISDVKQCQHELQKECSDLRCDLTNLDKSHVGLMDKTTFLENELKNTKSLILSLTEQQHFKDQQGNNLEVSGVPQIKGENLYNIIHRISMKIGYVLSPNDIDFIHRVRRFGNKSNQSKVLDVASSMEQKNQVPNIIIKFTQRNKKNDFLAAVRTRRGLTTADIDIDGTSKAIFINDHLTPHNKTLFKQVRKMALASTRPFGLDLRSGDDGSDIASASISSEVSSSGI